MKNFPKFVTSLKYARDKVFLLLLSKDEMNKDEIDIFCAKNNITFIDYKEKIISNLFPGQFANIIEFDNELKRMQDICKKYSGKVILFYNFDLILSYFDYDTRIIFWDMLYSRLPHLEAIPGIPIFSLSALLPNNLSEWREDNRIFD